jgi:hypothetical protein
MISRMDPEPLPMNWLLPSGEFIVIADVDVLPQVGDGIYTGGVAYRVSDLWLIDDNQTPLPYGWVVFLRLADDDRNPLRDFDEDFFK